MERRKKLNCVLICIALVLTMILIPQTLCSTGKIDSSNALYSRGFQCSQGSSQIEKQDKIETIETLELEKQWPEHDELTENIDWPPLNPWPALSVSGYGTWYELRSGIWGNVMMKDNRGYNVCFGNYSVMSRVRAFGIGDPYWVPHFVVFWPSSGYLDLTKWHYIKYFIALGGYCDGYCEFGFFNGDIEGDYECAYVQYSASNNYQFYPRSFDISDHSKWIVSAGFDWTCVNGFAFFASTYAGDGSDSGANDVWIDLPILYNSDQDLPYGTIDFQWRESDSTRLCTELIHCGPEFQPDYDQWAIHCTVKNKWRTSSSYFAPYVKLAVIIDDVAMVFPDSYEPRSGTFDTESFMSWSIPETGVSIPLKLPKLKIDFTTYTKDNLYYMQWICMDPLMGTALMGSNVITDVDDFVVPFIVPSGFKPFVCVMAEVQWYEIHQHKYKPPLSDTTLCYFSATRYRQEQLWLTVDPPECVIIDPEEENPANLPTDLPGGTHVSSLALRGTNFLVNGGFEQSNYGEWHISPPYFGRHFVIKHTGTASLIAGAWYLIGQHIDQAVFGDELMLSCWARPIDSEDACFDIMIEFTDGTFDYTTVYAIADTWSQLRFKSGQHKQIKAAYIRNGPSGIFFDDFEVYKIDNFETRRVIRIATEVRYEIPNHPLEIVIKLIDSSGQEFALTQRLFSIHPVGNTTHNIICAVPSNAALGSATIKISLWSGSHTDLNAFVYNEVTVDCQLIQGPTGGGGGGGGGRCYMM